MAEVLNLDARKLNTITLSKVKAGAVISGLPLLSLPSQAVLQIMTSAFGHLQEDGVMYQYTYGMRSPISTAVLDRQKHNLERIGIAKPNLPPASVYRISRVRS